MSRRLEADKMEIICMQGSEQARKLGDTKNETRDLEMVSEK